MTETIRDRYRTDVSPALALAAGVVCGMFAALVAQILLARHGIELAGVWRDLFAARGLQLKAAVAWWIMTASALLTGAAVAAALKRFPLPWTRLRLARWAAGAWLVFVLANVGHSGALKAGGNVAMHAASSLTALGAAALMALFGAYFAIRR